MNACKMKRLILLLFVSTAFLFGPVNLVVADYYDDVSKQLRLFNELYKRLVVNYVDQVDPDALIQAGIDGMLETLDPYTVYLENEEQHGIRTLTDGEYGGIGLRLGVRNDTLTVIAPMDGTPAYRAGIQSGDRIVQIDTLMTTEMRLSKAASVMRGKPGSVVTLTVVRPGYNERLPFALVREVIAVHDVAYSGIIEDGIMYLKLTSFSKNSGDEIRDAIAMAGESNIRGFVLDLRDNPGGLLASALEIADLFVEPDKKILMTKGRDNKITQVFHSRVTPVLSKDVPMAVLVNQGSASASEIVSGILQDLDRAVIIGHDTFGKGLVQTVMPLNRDASLKITTAKYYIPSGRLIQKEDYFRHNVIQTSSLSDSVFFTQNKRKVFGGGGITPDIITTKDTLPVPVKSLWAKGLFFEYAVEYHNKHEDREWPFSINEDIINDFVAYTDRKDFSFQSKSARLFKEFQASLDSTTLSSAELNAAKQAFAAYFEGEGNWKEDPVVRRHIGIRLTQEFASTFAGTDAKTEATFLSDRSIKTALRTLSDQPDYLERLGFASSQE